MYRSHPYTIEPNYSQLVGFHISMIVPDLLHCWNLGVSRDIIGSVLKIILTDGIVFQAPNLPIRLLLASASLRQFAKQKKLPLRLKKLTKAKLSWKSRQYPSLASSGYESYVVMLWLESLLSNHAEIYAGMATLVWTSNHAISLMYSAGLFLTPSEKENLTVLGNTFLSLYVSLAKNAMDANKLLWRIRPKFHLMNHLFVSHRWVNPAAYSTWMDEDYLKKVGKTLNLTSIRNAQKRLLQRWCLSIPRHLQRTLISKENLWSTDGLWKTNGCPDFFTAHDSHHGNLHVTILEYMWSTCFLDSGINSSTLGDPFSINVILFFWILLFVLASLDMAIHGGAPPREKKTHAPQPQNNIL